LSLTSPVASLDSIRDVVGSKIFVVTNRSQV
jgi:hypothetical protein